MQLCVTLLLSNYINKYFNIILSSDIRKNGKTGLFVFSEKLAHKFLKHLFLKGNFVKSFFPAFSILLETKHQLDIV